MKCYLVSYYGISNAGGVERVCYYIKTIMESKNYEIVVVDKSRIENYWMGKLLKLILGRIPLLIVGMVSSLFVLQKKKRGDILITNGFNCPYVHADILFIHGTMAGYGKALGTKYTWKTKIPLLFETAAVKRARHIVAVSHNAIDEVKKFYTDKLSDARVLNNMVNDTIFFPIPSERNTLGIIYCGRLDFGKGYTKLKNLCDYIDANHIPAKVYIAANNSHNSEVFAMNKCVEINIRLDINQLNEFYNRGDVMFFPSMYEGFEMVTLEALSAGIPVLGNSVGAVGELTSRNEPGVDIIKEPDNPELIIKQLSSLADKFKGMDSRQKLHQYYKQNYGVAAYVNRLNTILTNINM